MKHIKQKRKASGGYSIRLGDELEKRLDNAAAQTGIDKPDLIRVAVKMHLDQSAKTGAITLPVAEHDTPKTNQPQPRIVKQDRANAG